MTVQALAITGEHLHILLSTVKTKKDSFFFFLQYRISMLEIDSKNNQPPPKQLQIIHTIFCIDNLEKCLRRRLDLLRENQLNI